MRDINLTKRTDTGNVSFRLNGDVLQGIEILLQKVTIALLSETKNEDYIKIYGANFRDLAKYNLGSDDLHDIRMSIHSSLTSLEKQLKLNDSYNGSSASERLGNLTLSNLVLKDATTLEISILVTNELGKSETLTLPVRK